MLTDGVLPAGAPLGFALVLARVSGAFTFVPLPTKDAGPGMARVLLALAVTFALFPRWPSISPDSATPGLFVVWMISEAAFGLAAGLLIGFLGESLTFAAQVLGLQAGYGYASVIDPSTQADSDVLQVVARLTGGMLFFAFGLDREVLRVFAASLQRYPPGQFVLTRPLARLVWELGANIFVLGLRLALPVVGMLLMIEISLALVGRISAQLQLGHSSMPLKMLLTLVALAALLKVAPGLYLGYAQQVLEAMRHGLG